MIVDCHAHVFTHWIGACGHPTAEIHKRYLQRVVTPVPQRMGGAYCKPPWVHSAFWPRSTLRAESLPTLRSKLSP